MVIQIRKRRTIQSRAERKTSLRWEEGERERESRDYLHAFLWYNAWLNHHCASSCKCMCTYLIQRVCKECVSLLLPFPLWSRAVQEGRLVGWRHRKGNSLYQTADGGQHVLTLQKHTHKHRHAHTCSPTYTTNYVRKQ